MFEHFQEDDPVRRRSGIGPDGSGVEPATVSLEQGSGSGMFPIDGSFVAAHRDAEAESMDADGADGTEIVSEISATGESWGVLGVHTTERDGFDGEATAFVERIADVLGTAIESSRERAGAVEHHCASSEAFISIDERWRFVHINDRAAEFFGQDAETLRDEVVWDAVPEESTLADRFREAMAAGETGTVEYALDPIGHRGSSPSPLRRPASPFVSGTSPNAGTTSAGSRGSSRTSRGWSIGAGTSEGGRWSSSATPAQT